MIREAICDQSICNCSCGKKQSWMTGELRYTGGASSRLPGAEGHPLFQYSEDRYSDTRLPAYIESTYLLTSVEWQ